MHGGGGGRYHLRPQLRQNSSLSFDHNLNNNPFLQNRNLPFNSYPQNPNFAAFNPYSQHLNSPLPQRPFTQSRHAFPPAKRDEGLIQRIEQALAKAQRDLLAAGDSVSAWKVSQSALLALQVDSWSSLGFQFQDIPSLYRLILAEGKVNAFIHCFVGVRRITSVYDLEVAICKNEGIEQFEQLGMGPLLRHPLIEHYFSVPSYATDIVKITSEEIIACLADFMDTCGDKEIRADAFLDSLAKKWAVSGKERLGVRIQSLGLHITSIKEARQAENDALKRYLQGIKPVLDKQTRKDGMQPLTQYDILSEKKKLDRRFDSISERFKSFSSGHESFRGKHIRFVSSSSEDESEDENSNIANSGGQNRSSSHNISTNSQRASSCPYPSAAEEMIRLGLAAELDNHGSPVRGSLNCNENEKSLGKKRKCEKQSEKDSSLHKHPKRDSVAKKDELLPQVLKSKRRHENSKDKAHDLQCPPPSAKGLQVYEKSGKKLQEFGIEMSKKDQSHCQGSEYDDLEMTGELLLTTDALDKLVTTWKDTCREYPVPEVFRRMVDFYNITGRRRKKMKEFFSTYPGIGLLNVAVNSIKRGMWDSLYDTLETIGESGFVGPASTQYTEMIDIGPSPRQDAVQNSKVHISKLQSSVTVEDIIEKIASFFELEPTVPTSGSLILQKHSISFRRFHECEASIMQQFSVKRFGDLGHGDFLEFMDKHICLPPHELCEDLNAKVMVSMLEGQLLLLVSQAAGELLDNVVITKQQIHDLLTKQFPLVSLQVAINAQEDCSDLIKNQKIKYASSCVFFSSALLGGCTIGDTSVCKVKNALEISETMLINSGALGTVSRKDALGCLLKAPMLSDLLSWSHWDLVFAPSLGPLLEWLLNEVHTKELLCVATRDGKLIRIDHLVTVDNFLEALLQGSAFQTALKLLSLLVLYGGAHLVPMSLLKCYAHRGIEVIMENSLSSGSVNNKSRSLMHERQIIFGKVSTGNSSLVEPSDDAAGIREKNDPVEYLSHMNKAVSVAAKFIIDCLVYLPLDFRSFAAGILLAGLRDFTKDAPAFILRECIQNDQRFMLHEIGISLGILEWIEDYRGFISARDTKLYGSAEATSKTSEIPSPAIGSIAEHPSLTTACFSSEDGTESIVLLDGECEEFTKISEDEALKQVPRENSCCCDGSDLDLSEFVKEKDAALIIESIRRDEFGLDPNLMLSESNLLKKQHARLGRALHCLSQELYSQDSHFLLELVQNADDNFYPENVEPTLVFILRATGIVVLNNERGFLAKNIRALCDVGNSTKKGSGAGYIGQKGIGFKSVFRVTNAPEIHSNGFHVKFDASEGQIGFVLPTLVPPCDINLFVGHISGEGDPIDKSSWNTCIVLPFREKLQEGTGMSSIMSMFSDLHPSLLLFLHRLQCIKFRNMFNNSLVVMRRESVGDGIIKVSHGKEKMSWLIASQKLQASSIRPDVKSTEISVAFTLQESNDGEYRPHLELQPVFAFLPLRTYGLKFILQGDFVLPSSREEVDGDSAWNQWLLSEFPALFVDAEKSFCGLSCFQESPGRAVTAYMSFVPLVGEVHGFFSHLPHMIISKLRMSNCLLLDGKNEDWVPPCRVIRGWDEQGRALLPEILLHRHLGLGYLHKDIILPDPLAMALGVQEYGPKILADIMSSICSIENGIESLGLDWLSNWFCVLYATLSVNPLRRHTQNPGTECDVLKDLNKISFIPLSDGSYGSLIDGPIWLPCDAFGSGLEGEQSPKDFPNLYAKLRMVNPVLLSIDNANTSSKEDAKVSTLVRMLYKIGVQRLSPHEVIKGHILPALANNTFVIDDKYLMAEYLSFAMHHLQSTCPSCHIERMEIVSELQQKAVVLTNSGYKHPFKDSIHFSKEFGNPVDITRLLGGEDAEWHELDSIYLKHPSIPSLSGGLTKWREFFQVIGVTDFVQVIHVDNEGTDVSHAFSKNMISNGDVNSGGMVVDDWVSPELVQLLTVVSMKGNREKCKYLLEVLDKLWDDHFSEKVTMYCVLRFTEGRKPFGSSFMNSIHNFKWVASSMDEELHQPKDLFCDCEAVRSVMGDFAPYAIPQVRSEKFLREIGFKMQVNIDDALTLLRYWRTCIPPVCASIAQMSKFYNFIWDGMTSSRVKIMEELKRGPFIFVPFINRSRHEDVVSGIFFSPDEVYWQDPSGCVDQMKELVLHCSLGNESGSHSSKMLADFYPHLHDFFVKECGVSKVPPFHSYLQLLLQLSRIALPSQAAKVVFSVLLKWADDVKSGLVASQGIASLKEGLLKVDTTVLPTVQDRWVSLHSSFGLVCWCDDLELRKQFIHSSNIDFLYFGETSSEEGEMLSAKLVTLMQALGVPALSEAVSREAIFYGTEDCRATASLVNWVLPYAQRYLYKQHSDIYFSLKQLGFANLIQLQVVVVEKLFYKHVIKGCTTASKKRCECSCLVQGNTLYVTKAADSHSVFLELSRLFFKGSADLHLANFLHMVATMAESGSTEEQVEFFIVANQKIPKLPSEEPLWSLACLHVLNKDDGTQPLCDLPMNTENPSKIRRKAGISSNWPPTDWKTAPDFNFARSNGFKTKRGTLENDDSHIKSYNPDDSAYSKDCAVSFEINGDWVIADNATTTTSLGLQEHKDVRNEPQLAMQLVSYDMPEGIALEQFRQPESSILHDQDVGTSTFATRDQLCFGTPNGNQLFITGRLGELVAYKYFSEKLGSTAVRWVNEETETGLPYDMVIGEDGSKEYIEVKATKSWNKDWFMISTREWQFAAEKGDSFSIAHVVLADPKSAKITLFKDPIRLCQQDVLHLAVLMRKQPKESSVT